MAVLAALRPSGSRGSVRRRLTKSSAGAAGASALARSPSSEGAKALSCMDAPGLPGFSCCDVLNLEIAATEPDFGARRRPAVPDGIC